MAPAVIVSDQDLTFRALGKAPPQRVRGCASLLRSPGRRFHSPRIWDFRSTKEYPSAVPLAAREAARELWNDANRLLNSQPEAGRLVGHRTSESGMLQSLESRRRMIQRAVD